MIHIKRIQEDGADVIVLIGEIDASSSIELDLAIAKSVGEGFSKILIDCSSLDYICLCRTSKSSKIVRSKWCSLV
jgi:anti-sigma B factor antagonist